MKQKLTDKEEDSDDKLELFQWRSAYKNLIRVGLRMDRVEYKASG